MEIGFVHVARAQPFRADARPGPEAPREVPRVDRGATTGLSEPFNARRDEARVVSAQLGADALPAQPKNSDAQRDAATSSKALPNELSAEQQAVVDQLAARDREVRNHEEAHARVGGQYAGSPSYTFQEGPDGKQYAIGGEVPIDVSPVADDPEATIVKMEVVKAAALAPAEPSGQDRKVAALADAQRQQAIADLAELRRQTEPVAQPTMRIAA